ncbi:DNA cytosine methyltransferase, partial [Corynebacterium sp. 209RC1]|nr:DNA cytosine methyltransferase [Corynebacterium sp. 209RC1]
MAQTLQAGEVNQATVLSDLRIRKLTPLECWRLQGFTDEQFYKAKNDGVSNSQLYKQAGNAVTVNVVDAIISNLE